MRKRKLKIFLTPTENSIVIQSLNHPVSYTHLYFQFWNYPQKHSAFSVSNILCGNSVFMKECKGSFPLPYADLSRRGRSAC